MSPLNYYKAMALLDILELELNKLAVSMGYPTFKEFARRQGEHHDAPKYLQ